MNLNFFVAFVAALFLQCFLTTIAAQDPQTICTVQCPALKCQYGSYTPVSSTPTQCPVCPQCRPGPCMLRPCAYPMCTNGFYTPNDQYGCPLCPICNPQPAATS